MLVLPSPADAHARQSSALIA